MVKYEYSVKPLPRDLAALTSELAQIAGDGWEVISILQLPTALELPIPDVPGAKAGWIIVSKRVLEPGSRYKPVN